jgi:hypothetical protein
LRLRPRGSTSSMPMGAAPVSDCAIIPAESDGQRPNGRECAFRGQPQRDCVKSHERSVRPLDMPHRPARSEFDSAIPRFESWRHEPNEQCLDLTRISVGYFIYMKDMQPNVG